MSLQYLQNAKVFVIQPPEFAHGYCSTEESAHHLFFFLKYLEVKFEKRKSHKVTARKNS